MIRKFSSILGIHIYHRAPFLSLFFILRNFVSVPSQDPEVFILGAQNIRLSNMKFWDEVVSTNNFLLLLRLNDKILGQTSMQVLRVFIAEVLKTCRFKLIQIWHFKAEVV